jgi:amidohydrolase
LDALPIEEKNNFDHHSTVKGVSHKCGHDGHMAMVAGLIFWIKEQDFKSGKIILLFQPAEETGEGANKMINDPKYKNLNPDFVFALHNIPSEPMHTILLLKENFTATVISLAIELKGKECHAAEPNQGINPAIAISTIISELAFLNNDNPSDQEFSILTAIHINMGQKSYGISPAKGELHYTIRTWTIESMERLKTRITDIVTSICERHQLKFHMKWIEYFPSVKNDPSCVSLVKEAAKTNGYQIMEKPYAYRFGEDFGWFSQKHKAAMFGIGSGFDSPALHHADYDFPDEILETGMDMFKTIITDILG